MNVLPGESMNSVGSNGHGAGLLAGLIAAGMDYAHQLPQGYDVLRPGEAIIGLHVDQVERLEVTFADGLSIALERGSYLLLESGVIAVRQPTL